MKLVKVYLVNKCKYENAASMGIRSTPTMHFQVHSDIVGNL